MSRIVGKPYGISAYVKNDGEWVLIGKSKDKAPKEDSTMELKDTIEMMSSTDYKERFKAEYQQTKIRYDKLSDMLEKYRAGILEFEPTCPGYLLTAQATHMRNYLSCLEQRAEIEGIEL